MNLIIGATGLLGYEICQQLSNKNVPLRAMVRKTSDPAKIENLKKLGVEIITGDIRNPASFSKILYGVSTVISTISSIPFSYVPEENNIKKVDLKGMIQFINYAKKMDVCHFIYTSLSGNISHDFPLCKVKRMVENHLINTGMVYTILRPSFFMEVWLSHALGLAINQGKARLCGKGTNPISFISYKDVARFAVESITNLSAKNAILELGGPTMLSQLKVVELYEKVTGKEFDLQFYTEKEIQSDMEKTKDPMRKSLLGLMLSYANGDPINMDKIFKDFPIKPLSVKQYAQNMPAQT